MTAPAVHVGDTTLTHRAAFNRFAEERSRVQARLLGVPVESLRTGEWVATLFQQWIQLTREQREEWILIASGQADYRTNLD
ncbi:MAG: hypothetical protein ACRDHE_17145 [Ktedonobacterales bacterium]